MSGLPLSIISNSCELSIVSDSDSGYVVMHCHAVIVVYELFVYMCRYKIVVNVDWWFLLQCWWRGK